MDCSTPERVEELIRVYRAHNVRLYAGLASFAGWWTRSLAEGGRAAARRRDRQAERDAQRVFEARAASGIFDAVVARHRATQA